MPGWNGAGIYDLRYVFVNDALASVKILASRQDAMWSDLKVGIQNCLTLDGQNVLASDLNMNGHKVTNIVAATGPSDAVRLDQVISNEWVAETHSTTWVSANSFKIGAADVTGTYLPGRRVKFLDAGNQRYATVIASSFAIDTTLTLQVDGGTALTGPTSSVYYGLVSPINSSAPKLSSLIGNGSTVVPSNATTVLNPSFNAVDNLLESSGGRLTVKTGGTYLLEAVGFFSAGGANITSAAQFSLSAYKNGSAASGGLMGVLSWPFASGVSNNFEPLSGFAIVPSTVPNDILDVRLTTPTYSGSSSAWQGGLRIVRIA